MNERLKADGARRKHVDRFVPRASPRTDFDRALLKLTGYTAKHQLDGVHDGRLEAMRAALEYRATVHQIRDWRKGKPAPKWARDLLASKLEEYGEAAARLRSA